MRVALGESCPPDPVRFDGVASRNQVTLTWQPDASAAIASSFDILGAHRGQPLQHIAAVDGVARSWTGSLVPRGSYTVGVIARNNNGASDVSGPPPEYLVEVGSGTGLPDIARLTLSGARADLQVAAPGRYLVRVRARNDCGVSAASNQVVVFVP